MHSPHFLDHPSPPSWSDSLVHVLTHRLLVNTLLFKACAVSTIKMISGAGPSEDKASHPDSFVNIYLTKNFFFQQNQSQRSIHVPPALWPSPVRNSSVSMWSAITLFRSSHKHIQENISNQRIPVQANTAGVTKVKIKRSKKGPKFCLKV